MTELPLASRLAGYALIAVIGLYTVLLGWWQAMVLSGRPMQNPDGSTDDWRVHKTHFGMAVADLLLTCPVSIGGIALVFLAPRWGYFVLSLIAFWFVWANLMTTSMSLRFERPRITLSWLFVFPSGILVGGAYLFWMVIHFDVVLAQ